MNRFKTLAIVSSPIVCIICVLAMFTFVPIKGCYGPSPGPMAPVPDKDNPIILPYESVALDPGHMTRIDVQSLYPVKWILDPSTNAEVHKGDKEIYITPTVPIDPHTKAPKTQALKDIYLGVVCYVSGTTLSEVKWIKLTINSPTPTPGPIPPTPPTPPTPPVPPTPPTPPQPPAPIAGDGFRVLIVEDKKDRARNPYQALIINSEKIRSYLDDKCTLEAETKWKAWRMYDSTIEMKDDLKTWQDAMKRPRFALPWIIISDGKTGYEGPLPKTVDNTLALLKKYGDK